MTVRTLFSMFSWIVICFFAHASSNLAFTPQGNTVDISESSDEWTFLCPQEKPNFYMVFSANNFWYVGNNHEKKTTRLKRISISDGDKDDYEVTGNNIDFCFVNDVPIGIENGNNVIEIFSMDRNLKFSKLYSGTSVGEIFSIDNKYVCFPRLQYNRDRDDFEIDLVSFSVAQDDDKNFVLEDCPPLKIPNMTSINPIFDIDVAVSSDEQNVIIASVGLYSLSLIKRRSESQANLEWEEAYSIGFPTHDVFSRNGGSFEWETCVFSVSPETNYIAYLVNIFESNQESPARIQLFTITEYPHVKPFFEQMTRKNSYHGPGLQFVAPNILFLMSDGYAHFLKIDDVPESQIEHMQLESGGKRHKAVGRLTVDQTKIVEIVIQEDEELVSVSPIPDSQKLRLIKLTKQGYFVRHLDWGKLFDKKLSSENED